jgi:hypothetical protein
MLQNTVLQKYPPRLVKRTFHNVYTKYRCAGKFRFETAFKEKQCTLNILKCVMLFTIIFVRLTSFDLELRENGTDAACFDYLEVSEYIYYSLKLLQILMFKYFIIL